MNAWLTFIVAAALAGATPSAQEGPGAGSPPAVKVASRARVQAIGKMNEGIATFQRGDAAGAEKALREAVALDGGYASAHLNLGKVLRSQGRLDDAAAALRPGLALPGLEPEDASDLGYELGVVLFQLAEAAAPRDRRARWLEVIAALDRAIAADPRRYKAHYRRGLALDHLDRVSEADDAYRQCIALRPSDSRCLISLGELYAECGHPDAAVQIFEAGARANPQDAAIPSGRARVEYRRGSMQEAIKAAEEAVRLDPGAPEGWYVLGMARAELRLRIEAVEALEKFLSLAPPRDAGLIRAANDMVARMRDVR